MSTDWTPTVYRDLWADELRLRVGGRDVTYFRGVVAQVGGYQLQEPYAYGPADFSFPQVTQFEVDRFGERGDLAWLHHSAHAELLPATDGEYGERVWAGFVTGITVTEDGVAVHCDGELSGRLALRDRQPPIFAFKEDLGLITYDALNYCGVHMLPYLGPHTGIERFTTNGGGADYLAFVNETLAEAITDDGDQWTIARAGRRFRMRLKDTTTVHATVFLGAHGVELDVNRDVQEEPTTIYGTGVDPTGQKITNPAIPNLFATEPAEYPFNDNRTFGPGTENAETDTGAGITVLVRKLGGEGYMTRREAADSQYDSETVRAVKALQRRAGLPRTGLVNPATWRALFNITIAGRTLAHARILPMAQLPAVQRYNLTSNGSLDSANPAWDPRRVVVDRTIDHGGGVWKEDMLEWSGRYLDRIHGEKNWVGTLALTGADVFAGNITANTANPTPLSRLDLREGWNIKVVGFDGNTRFHIGGINVDSDRNVKLAIDTRSRDLLTLGQIIARNKESRRHPAREFALSVRRPNAINTVVTSNELFGRVDRYRLNGGKWNRIMVPCGQSGTIDRVRVLLEDNHPEYVMAVTVDNVSPGRLAAVAGSNPLHPDSKWRKPHVQHRLKVKHLCLYAAGQARQPLGYYPRALRDEKDKLTDAPLTGKWEDDAGFAFRTFREDRIAGVLYLHIFPDRDCVLPASKVFWVNQAEGL